jgi:hypothetical protein
MKHSVRNHGLSIVLFGLFLLCEGGLSFVGQHQYNQEQLQHGQPQLGHFEYLAVPASWKQPWRTGRVNFCKCLPMCS